MLPGRALSILARGMHRYLFVTATVAAWLLYGYFLYVHGDEPAKDAKSKKANWLILENTRKWLNLLTVYRYSPCRRRWW
jgi:hypothetical protein